jgi:hypothetical protein
MAAKPKFKLTIAQLHQLRDENGGICLACGCLRYGGVAPDARGYVCENGCGAKAVVGIEEVLTKGCIEFVSGDATGSVLAIYLDPHDSEDSDCSTDLE